MKWQKKGRIYTPDPQSPDASLYGILPTPEYLPESNVIRIYFAATDIDRIGRIFRIDVDADDPSHLLQGRGEPLLDAGDPGAFDDCGVNPCSVVRNGSRRYLYYMGYQRSVRTPYLLFSGLAIEDESGRFNRYSKVPILERNDRETTIRSAPMVIQDGDKFGMWYVSADRWERMTGGLFDGRTMPVYVIRHARSTDGIHWTADPTPCIAPADPDEFGFGRPWVLKDGERYRMWYSRRRRMTSYRIGYAESSDGITWRRMDEEAGIDVSAEGWDSEMVCYAAVLPTPAGTYMFYNGNRNGETGFGYAVLTDAVLQETS